MHPLIPDHPSPRTNNPAYDIHEMPREAWTEGHATTTGLHQCRASQVVNITRPSALATLLGRDDDESDCQGGPWMETHGDITMLIAYHHLDTEGQDQLLSAWSKYLTVALEEHKRN